MLYARMIVGGTRRWHPLSAANDHPSIGSAMPGPQSMLLVIGVRKPVSRLLRDDCSDHALRSSLQSARAAWWIGQLGMFKYYVYSRSPLSTAGSGLTDSR